MDTKGLRKCRPRKILLNWWWWRYMLSQQ